MKNSVNDCYLLVWEFPSFSMIFFDKLASYVKFLGNKKQMTKSFPAKLQSSTQKFKI